MLTKSKLFSAKPITRFARHPSNDMNSSIYNKNFFMVIFTNAYEITVLINMNENDHVQKIMYHNIS